MSSVVYVKLFPKARKGKTFSDDRGTHGGAKGLCGEDRKDQQIKPPDFHAMRNVAIGQLASLYFDAYWMKNWGKGNLHAEALHS